jgi:hypothetical protein
LTKGLTSSGRRAKSLRCKTVGQRNRSHYSMDVEIVIFPETKVALIEHHGPPALEYETGKIRDGSIFL